MDKNCRVIVIGASIGGEAALFRVVSGLAPDLAAPVVIVMHIGAHQSELPRLLSAKGPLPAVFARTGVVPQAATIYVAPPDHHLLLEEGAFRLARGPKEHFSRPAIDPLFRSAALSSGNRVVGVMLTGMLDDGSAGLNAIKECGGTTIVQNPAEALELSMPRSAISTVEVDHLMELDAMADLLNQISRPLEPTAPDAPHWLHVEHEISLGRGHLEDLGRVGMPSRLTCPDCGGALFEIRHGKPIRFLCHMGHAYNLRSLKVVHEVLTEKTLWEGLRALQEKEAILHRTAEVQAWEAPGSEIKTMAEARNLSAFIAQMSAVIQTRESLGGILF